MHRWSSIVCTLFPPVLCVGGPPLLFGDELHAWLDPQAAYATVAAESPRFSLDGLVRATQLRRPGEIVVTASMAAADAGEHFGDYGGLPSKLLRALFDMATILVLVAGLQLFLKPGRAAR